MNEFTIAFEDHKPIGVLRGPWEMDEVFENMLDKSHRKGEGVVIFEENPKQIVARLIETVQRTKTCDLGESCPAYVYENYDDVGGKGGERVM